MTPVAEANERTERGLLEQLVLAGVGWATLTAGAADDLADDLARRVGIDRDEMRAAMRDAVMGWRREEHDDLALRVAQLEHRLRLLERER